MFFLRRRGQVPLWGVLQGTPRLFVVAVAGRSGSSRVLVCAGSQFAVAAVGQAGTSLGRGRAGRLDIGVGAVHAGAGCGRAWGGRVC